MINKNVATQQQLWPRLQLQKHIDSSIRNCHHQTESYAYMSSVMSRTRNSTNADWSSDMKERNNKTNESR